MIVKTAQSGYDLTRMKASVEGPESKTVLTLSEPMDFRDIIGAFQAAYQGIQERDRSENKGIQGLR